MFSTQKSSQEIRKLKNIVKSCVFENFMEQKRFYGTEKILWNRKEFMEQKRFYGTEKIFFSEEGGGGN